MNVRANMTRPPAKSTHPIQKDPDEGGRDDMRAIPPTQRVPETPKAPAFAPAIVQETWPSPKGNRTRLSLPCTDSPDSPDRPAPSVQITGPKPLAGEQAVRLPLRGNGLGHSSPDRAFVAPTGGTCGPRESFARGLRSRPNPLSRRGYSCGHSLSFRPPQAIVGPRLELKERLGMLRPRLEVCTVES